MHRPALKFAHSLQHIKGVITLQELQCTAKIVRGNPGVVGGVSIQTSLNGFSKRGGELWLVERRHFNDLAPCVRVCYEDGVIKVHPDVVVIGGGAGGGSVALDMLVRSGQGVSPFLKCSFVEASLQVLTQLSTRALMPLLEFKPRLNSAVEGIQMEIRYRLELFLRGGPMRFFNTIAEAVAWSVAEKWEQWESRMTPQHEREVEIARCLKIRVPRFALNEFNPFAVLQKLETRQPLVWKHALQSEMSLGESPSTPAHFSMGLESGTIRASQGGDVDRKWWWQDFAQDERERLPTFLDTWETGALFYEFHRRLASLTEPDYIRRNPPWILLHHTVQGLIYHLWPPKTRGPHWRVPPWDFERSAGRRREDFLGSPMNDFKRFVLFDDEARKLTVQNGLPKSVSAHLLQQRDKSEESRLIRFGPQWLPLNDVIAAVLAVRKVAEDKRPDLWSYLNQTSPNPHHLSPEHRDLLKAIYNKEILRGKEDDAKPRRLSRRWQLLRALDERAEAKELISLSKGERVEANRFLHDYQDACAEVGIPAFIDNFAKLSGIDDE